MKCQSMNLSDVARILTLITGENKLLANNNQGCVWIVFPFKKNQDMFVIAPLASRKMNSNMNSQIISFRDILCKMFGNFKLLRSHSSNNLLCVFGKSIIQINLLLPNDEKIETLFSLILHVIANFILTYDMTVSTDDDPLRTLVPLCWADLDRHLYILFSIHFLRQS